MKSIHCLQPEVIKGHLYDILNEAVTAKFERKKELSSSDKARYVQELGVSKETDALVSMVSEFLQNHILQFEERVRHDLLEGSSGPPQASKQVRYSQQILRLSFELYQRSRTGYLQLAICNQSAKNIEADRKH